MNSHFHSQPCSCCNGARSFVDSAANWIVEQASWFANSPVLSDAPVPSPQGQGESAAAPRIRASVLARLRPRGLPLLGERAGVRGTATYDGQHGYSETKHALERFMGRGTATSARLECPTVSHSYGINLHPALSSSSFCPHFLLPS